LPILLCAAIRKILDSCVHLVAIKMSYLHSIRSWTKKSTSNKTVNRNRDCLSVLHQANIRVAAACVQVPL
jgi:hypothetical protein